MGTFAAIEMGAKSARLCLARPAYWSDAVVDEKVRLWNRRVWPSGSALATTSAPTEPPAPPIFSTITD
jgi:hypothetical protein